MEPSYHGWVTEEGKETEAGAILRQCLGGGIQASMPTIQMSASEGVAKSIFLAITENQYFLTNHRKPREQVLQQPRIPRE
jgi:hypothetical protein